MRRRWVLPLLIVSGFCGLAYELLWVRLLTLSLGATTASFSIVLAVFFGGLALGSRWAGGRSRTTSRPLFTYAVLEGVTGALGLVLYPALTHLGAVVAWIDPGPTAAGALVRLLLAAILLLPPTFLMGATLPFVSVGTIDRNESTGSGGALVYGLNTLGACLGAAAITFLMLPLLGIFGSTLVTALLNFAVGLVAFVLSRGPGRDGQATSEAPPPEASLAPAPSVDHRRVMAVMLSAAVGGFVATSAQVVWARFFAITLRGNAYGIGSVLVAVLIGISIGSLLASAAARRSTAPAVTAAIFLGITLFGLFVFAGTVPVMNWALVVLPNSGVVGTPLHLLDLAVVLVCLAIPTVASGAVLPSLITVLETSAARVGETLSRIYSANTLGCIAGSLATGFLLLPAIGSAATLYLAYVLLVATAAIFAIATCREHRGFVGGLVVLSLLGAAFFPQNDPGGLQSRSETRQDPFTFWQQQERAKRQNTIYEGDIATVAVSDTPRGKGLSLNGLGQGARYFVPPRIAFESTLVATVPWLHAAKHDRALVVGLGAGGTLDALTKLGVKQVEVAELERGVVDAVAQMWGDDDPVKKPGVSLVPNDARHHLLTARGRTPHSYDLITSMPAHPWVAAPLFTREFFQLALDNLAPGGVFSTWFGAGEMPDSSIEGLFGAFTSVFPNWIVYWVSEVGAFYMVGSADPIAFDLERARSLLRNPATAGIDPTQLAPQYLASRVTAASAPTKPATPKLVSTDDNGLIEFGVQRPRRSSLLASLGYFPVRSLPPAVVKGAPNLDGFMISVIDEALGQPRGWLPFGGGADRTAIERATSGLDERVSPSVHEYVKLRLALAEKKRDEAKAAKERISDAAIAQHAQVLLAVTEPTPQAALAALEGIEQPDVRAQRLALGGQDSGGELTELAVDADPLALLFSSIATLEAVPVLERAEWMARLQRRLWAFDSEVLARRCQTRLGEAKWVLEARLCGEFATDLNRARGRKLIGTALEAGSQGNYAAALKALVEANAIVTLEAPQANVLLQAGVELNDAKAVELATQLLLARGVRPETIEGTKQRARVEHTLQKAFPADAADAGLPALNQP